MTSSAQARRGSRLRPGTTAAPSLSPILRRHLDATPAPTPEEEKSALADIADARLAAWTTALSDPARSPAALRVGIEADALAPHVDGLPGLMWEQACDEAVRSRPRSQARARLPAAAQMFARSLVRIDATDDSLRAVVAALTKGPAAQVARSALAALDRRVRDLVDRNLRLVASVAHAAHRGAGPGRGGEHRMTLDDLMAHGVEGLERGVRGFNPSHGTRLSTYVVPWIRMSIHRSVADLSRAIRLPTHLLETMGKVHRLAREYARSLGREATPEEIAAAVGKPVATVEQILSGAVPGVTASLDAPAGGGTGERDDADGRVARLVDPSPTPEDMYAAAESAALVSRRVGRLLGRLTEREREVVERRHNLVALGDEDDVMLKDVGESLGISRQRAQQVYANAMRKMRLAAARSC